MQGMDVHMYSIDLVSVIFQSAFAHMQASLQASWCGGPSYNLQSHLVFLQGKVNSSYYISQVVNPVLLPFLRQEGDVLFQHDNARPQRLLRSNVLFVGCNNCLGLQDPQISLQLNTHGT